MKKTLAIVGAGGHGQQCAYVARTMNIWEEIVFFDDNIESDEVVDKITNISEYINDYDFFVGIGDNSCREKILERLFSYSACCINLIHSSAVISNNCKIGIGTICMPGSIINNNSQIGNGVIINSGSIIEHDCRIENYSHVCPGVTLAGGVHIGRKTFLGINSTVIQNTYIGENVFIGAHTLVIEDIFGEGTYIGNPARRLFKEKV